MCYAPVGPIGVFVYYFLFFFFQAEDGIRDWSVTGVQTCALPILAFILHPSSFILFPWCPSLWSNYRRHRRLDLRPEESLCDQGRHDRAADNDGDRKSVV